MKTKISLLSKQINQDTLGIVWLTDTELSLEAPGMYEMNYLMDGSLVKNLAKSKQDDFQNTSFFLGQNFGQPFFISHLIVKIRDDLKLLNQHLKIASSIDPEKKDVFIYNRSQNTANLNILKELSDKYNKLHFKLLNI